VGHAFARAWHLVGQHFGVVAAASLMVWMAFTAMLYAPCYGVLAMLFYGPLFGGLYMLFLKLIREGDASPGDLFVLTRESALPLMMTGLLTMILPQLVTFLWSALLLGGASCIWVAAHHVAEWSVWLLLVLCMIPGVYLQVAWIFGLPLVADRGMGFWEALGSSRRAVTGHWFKIFALLILAFLPFVAFHAYLLSRESVDVAPQAHKLFNVVRDAVSSGGAPNQTEIQKIAHEIDDIERSYSLWKFIRQCLLLVSLPFGVGSLAFVYEDLFGRKK
jgi:hypothetical protein